MSTPCVKGFITKDGEASYDFYSLGNLPKVLKTTPVATVGQFLRVDAVNSDGTIALVSGANVSSSGSGSGLPSSLVLLADKTTGAVYKLFVDNGKLQMDVTEEVTTIDSITLVDQTSGNKYSLCVSNGKLTMTESEE